MAYEYSSKQFPCQNVRFLWDAVGHDLDCGTCGMGWDGMGQHFCGMGWDGTAKIPSHGKPGDWPYANDPFAYS